MTDDRNKLCYNLLLKIFRDGAWASIELDKILNGLKEEDRPYLTKLFYGVLDKNVRFDFIIDKLTEKKPQAAVSVLIKMGLYMLDYMDMPSYAAVNNIVNLAKSVGKEGASGFINAILRNKSKVEFPPAKTVNYLSVNYSYPLWLVQMLNKQYGFDFTEQFLACELTSLTHIRRNGNHITKVDFDKKYADLTLESSKYGYYVTHNTSCKLDKRDYIIQSLSSIYAVYAYLQNLDTNEQIKILDVCAAPGGKAVLLKELCPNAEVTACDLYEHRVSLIKKYANSAGSDITAMQKDATILKEDWHGQFDLVVCDVPCSGIGVTGSKPDILLNRKPEDIKKLAEIQEKIMACSSNYVKKGGRLCYSTCTVLKQENEEIVNGFLNTHGNFVAESLGDYVENGDKFIRLYPFTHKTDGFFIAALKRDN